MTRLSALFKGSLWVNKYCFGLQKLFPSLAVEEGGSCCGLLPRCWQRAPVPGSLVLKAGVLGELSCAYIILLLTGMCCSVCCPGPGLAAGMAGRRAAMSRAPRQERNGVPGWERNQAVLFLGMLGKQALISRVLGSKGGGSHR